MISASKAHMLYLDYYDKNDDSMKDIEDRIVEAAQDGKHSIYTIVRCTDKVADDIKCKLKNNGYRASVSLLDVNKYMVAIDWSFLTDSWV